MTGFNLTVTQGGTGTTNTTTSVIATAVNDPPVITGATAGQATTDEHTINPFVGLTINDVDVGVSDSATIVLNPANGTLSGSGLISNGGGTYTLTAVTPAALTTELDALSFAPTAHQAMPGSTVTTGFTLTVTQGSAATTNTTTSVIATAANDVPTITGATPVSTNDETPVNPFTMTSVSNPDIGVTETVEVVLSSNSFASFTDADGTLSGAGLTKIGPGNYILTGSPTTVTEELQALTFTPTGHQVAPGQSVTTGVIILASQGNHRGIWRLL